MLHSPGFSLTAGGCVFEAVERLAEDLGFISSVDAVCARLIYDRADSHILAQRERCNWSAKHEEDVQITWQTTPLIG